MHPIHRHDLSPRLELLPLIDVVFLLLTFFILGMVWQRPVRTQAVELEPLGGERSLEQTAMRVLTLRADGTVELDEREVSGAGLDEALRGLATDPVEPTLYVVMERRGAGQPVVDRAGIAWEVQRRAQAAGLTRLVLVSDEGE